MLKSELELVRPTALVDGSSQLYYQVELKDFTIDLAREFIDWCADTYGYPAVRGQPDTGDRWYINEGVLLFKNLSDVEFLVLRWA